MCPAIKATLPKSGIEAYIDTAMRDVPVDSFWCGVLSIYYYIGTYRTACLVEQLNHNTPLGKIINIKIEDSIMDTGLYGSLWDIDVNILNHYVSTHS